jgi:hypothetical protein
MALFASDSSAVAAVLTSTQLLLSTIDKCLGVATKHKNSIYETCSVNPERLFGLRIRRGRISAEPDLASSVIGRGRDAHCRGRRTGHFIARLQ